MREPTNEGRVNMNTTETYIATASTRGLRDMAGRLRAECDRLRRVNAELVEALAAFLAARDAIRPPEEFKTDTMLSMGYWSPAAIMIDSKDIAALRAALAKAEGREP